MKPLTPDEYLAAITAANGPAEIEALATALFESLRTGNERTTANKLTPYNKLIRSIEPLIDGQNAYQYTTAQNKTELKHLHFKFTTDTINWAKHNAAAGQKMDSRIENPAIVHAEKFAAAMLQGLNSPDPYEKAAGLIAASGRREIEVWHIGTFTKTDDPYTVIFKGQAKRRDYDIPDDEKIKFPIKLLIPAADFLKIWKAFKALPRVKEVDAIIKGLEAELSDRPANERVPALRQRVNTAIGAGIWRASTFLFKDAFDGLDSIAEDHKASPHILRHAAVNIVTAQSLNTTAIGKQLKYAAEQLGHYVSGEDKIKDILSSISYINFEVEGTFPNLEDEFKTSNVRVYKSDVERLNQVKETLGAANHQDTVTWLLNKADRLIELEQENATLRRQIAEPATTTEPQSQPTEQTDMTAADITTLIQETVAAAVAAALAQQTQPQPVTAEPATEPQPATVQQTAEINPVSGRKKYAISQRGIEALDKVAAAFWAVVDYNEKQLTDSDRWYIGPALLRDLSGVNYSVVKRWYAENEFEVTEHNARFDLGPLHNRSHGFKKTKITDVVKMP